MSTLKVAGYNPVPDETNAVKRVNRLKAMEEHIIRTIEEEKNRYAGDARCCAEAITCIQTGMMWAGRAVFKPGRLDDAALAAAEKGERP